MSIKKFLIEYYLKCTGQLNFLDNLGQNSYEFHTLNPRASGIMSYYITKGNIQVDSYGNNIQELVISNLKFSKDEKLFTTIEEIIVSLYNKKKFDEIVYKNNNTKVFIIMEKVFEHIIQNHDIKGSVLSHDNTLILLTKFP